jgi:hypothetical protein
MYEILIIIAFLIIIFFIYLTITNDMNKPMMIIQDDDRYYQKPFHNSSNPIENLNHNPNNDYVLKINEEELKRTNEGYENELMFKNNLKNGDYIQYFQQEITTNVPTDNQIGFDIQPRERPYKLPYSNVHIKCL